MIYPATGWFRIIKYNDKQAYTIENLLQKMWLCRKPKPKIITYDFGNEFLGHAFKTN